MRTLSRLLALSTLKRRLLIRAASLLWLTRLVLCAVSLRRTRRTLFLVVSASRRVCPTRSTTDPADLAWAMATAARAGAHSCLVRALAAQALVELEGGQGWLVLGARRSPVGVLEAHAWLEQDGRVIVGAHDGGFAAIARFPRIDV